MYFLSGRLFVTIMLEKIFQLTAKEMNTDDWEISNYVCVLTGWNHNRDLKIIHTFIYSGLFLYQIICNNKKNTSRILEY